jgi:hypothetical protein
VVQALSNAARVTGADPALLLALAQSESRLDPFARNRLSSARGLMQFTRASWLEAVRDFGPRHGVGSHVEALSGSHSGSNRPSPLQPQRLTWVLALRDDPRLSALLAAERIIQARAGLEQALGRPAEAADLYAVHLLGSAGARRFLDALHRTPSRPATAAVGRDAVRRNRGVFFASGGRALRSSEVRAAMEGAVASARAELTTGSAANEVELAEAR